MSFKKLKVQGKSCFNEYELDIGYETVLRRIRRCYEMSDVSAPGWEPFMVTSFFWVVEGISIWVGWNLSRVSFFNNTNMNGRLVLGIFLFLLYGTFVIDCLLKIKHNVRWYEALKSSDDVLKLRKHRFFVSRKHR